MTGRTLVCLWFDGGIVEAADFYCRTIPDSWLGHSLTAPEHVPAIAPGETYVVQMTIAGIPVMLLNGGPVFPQTEAFSFQVPTDDQAETDRLWNAITADGGQEGQCGWCKDKWGVSWQIAPRALLAALSAPDRTAAARAQQAMMGMKRIDIAAIEDAFAGEKA